MPSFCFSYEHRKHKRNGSLVGFVNSVFKKEKVLTLITLKWKING